MNNFTKFTTFIIILFLMLFSNSGVLAQRAIDPLTDIVTLINGDTTATGERVNTSYTLENGGVYLALGSIQSDYNLKLSATGNAGAEKPKVIILTDQSGNSSTLFRPYAGGIELDGIYFSGVNSLGAKVSYILESQGAGVIVRAKNCVFDSIQTAVFRFNYDESSFFLEDCLIHDVWRSPHTGRVIDFRRTFMDTISIVNNTFYNISHDILGRFAGGSKYCKFDHNTVYALCRCPLRIDLCPEVIVTNNLFLNTGTAGYLQLWETEYQLQSENALGSRDEFARIELWPLSFDTTAYYGTVQKEINFDNNNWWIDPAIESQFPDTIYTYRNMDFDFEKEMIGEDTLTWISEDCNFTSVPPNNYLLLAQTNWADASNDGWSNEGFPFDFTYSTTSASYTAAKGGFPLGDLNWFPDQKTAWEAWIHTDVVETENAIPSEFSLGQNYPNPFNPATNIKFDIAKQGNYSLKVFNMLGQEVSTLVNGKLDAGVHQVTFNAARLSSGVYFYSLIGANINITKKMILIK